MNLEIVVAGWQTVVGEIVVDQIVSGIDFEQDAVGKPRIFHIGLLLVLNYY